MSRTTLILLAAAGSAAMLLGAFAFQYIGGLAPCQLCLWQRWPHAAAVLIGGLALLWGGRTLPLLGGAAAFTTAGIALFHTGVERKWWDGLDSCTAGSIEGLSGADLLNTAIDLAPVVRCDAVAWAMAGLSMASWNGIISVVLALIWLRAALRTA